MVRRAFTLMELLIVIAIIVVLMAIAVTVGASVISGGKAQQTRNTIHALDTLLNDIMQANGGLPGPLVEDPRDSTKMIPIADARNMGSATKHTINSVGLFLLQAGTTSTSSDALKGIDSKLIRLYTPYDESEAGEDNVVPELTTVMDAWGRPIRYVHPAFHGPIYGPDLMNPSQPSSPLAVADVLPGTTAKFTFDVIRRNAVTTPDASPVGDPDSDGGYCPNNTPYFYSAGPDGDPSTTKDNIYTKEPKFKSN